MAGNNARLVDQTYEKYIQWSDSIGELDADNKEASMKRKYEASLQAISDRDDTINAKKGLIVGLIIILVVSVAVMVLLCLALWRLIARNKKMHRAVDDANDRNAQKTMLIRNI